jgi:hypothetical protein
VYTGIDVTTLIASIDAYIAANPPVPAFDATNATTWQPITVQVCNGSALTGLQANWLTALQTGQLTDNSAAGGASCGVNYHAHTNGGSGGIAFRYTNAGGNAVTADVYDYATKRSGNDYHWKVAGTKGSGPP